jgi:putative exosortase-associated protein (TIGR04073 family)
MTMKRSLSILFGAALFLASVSAQAAHYKSPIDDSREDYSHAAGRKLGRGLANTGLGWVELFKGMSDVGAENGFWAGATWGPLYGAVNAVRRTGAGVFETVTFPFEGPNHFEPIVEPEFILNESR